MIRCDHHTISRYLDGELSLPDAVAFRRHMSDCQNCRNEVQSLRDVNQMLAAWGSQRLPLPPGSAARMRQSSERRKKSVRVFSLARTMPAAIGTAAAALLLFATANVGAIFHSQQPVGGSVASVENIRGLAHQSQPLLLARRASAVLDAHALFVPVQQRSKILFDES